jgi:hypothetical protein
MGNLLRFATHRKRAASPLTHQQNCAKWRRHRAIESVLLREYDAVVAELDAAKEDLMLPDQVRTVCKDYLKVIRRLSQFSGKGIVPLDIAKTFGNVN